MNLEAIAIAGLGATAKCIGTIGKTKVGEYIIGICTLWVV